MNIAHQAIIGVFVIFGLGLLAGLLNFHVDAGVGAK